jgi:Fe-S cluster biogenesis protein NfuA
MLIRTEQTPNPATRKFLPGQTVMEAGTRDFADGESAQASPLAAALFDSGMVEGVFFGRDFVSVTAAPGVSWSDPEPLVIETRVRPAVAQDGGDIVYKGYRDGHLYLSMHGACSGCPSSSVTLKRGIESLIRHYVPEVETVEAI